MSLVSLHEVSLSLGGKLLFENLSFSIEAQERVALVGHNGSGKSTLFRLLLGDLETEAGAVWRAPGVVVEKVLQFLPPEWRSKSLFDAIAENLPGGYQGAASDYLIEQALENARFNESQIFSPLGVLSGGEVNRAMLARALVREPDVILLDEPTNHLDLPSIVEFEEAIRSLRRCAVCIISHDREMLDRITETTCFLRDKRIHRFRMPFSAARAALRDADTAATKRRADEEKEVARVRRSAERLATWGQVFDNEKFSKRARSMFRRVERMEEDLTETPERVRAELSLKHDSTESSLLLELGAADVFRPDGERLFRLNPLWLRRGERLLLRGVNGCGKSTLLRTLVAAHENPGCNSWIRYAPSVSIGYYDQELSDLRGGQTLFEYARRHTPQADQVLIGELVRAGFPYERQAARVDVLSGGERARLRLLLLKLLAPSLLFLDEPTNHLDIGGIEALEHSLRAEGVSCIFVSHDRRFVEAVATRELVIERQE